MQRILQTLALMFACILLWQLWPRTPASADDEGAADAATPSCGDVNRDGKADLADPVYLLNWLFLGGPEPQCPATARSLPSTGQESTVGECPGQDGTYRAGCPAAGRFTDNGDGTVTDPCTGLVWQKETADVTDDGKIDDDDRTDWCSALEYCEGLVLAERDDWRLPNARELQSLVDYGRTDPAIDPSFGCVSASYWSSTHFTEDAAYSWNVDFAYGLVSVRLSSEAVRLHVRAVCDGP
jgi:hypothetical protein